MNSKLLNDGGAQYDFETPKAPLWPSVSIGVMPILGVLLPPGLITGLDCCLLFLAIVVWATSRRGLPRMFVQIVLPFLAICIVGLLSGIGADAYLYWKDAWYVSNAGLIICVGFVLYRAKPDLKSGLRAFVIGGTVAGVLYIVPFALHPSLLTLGVSSRDLVGTGYFAPALALLIMVAFWFDPQAKVGISKWLMYCAAALCFIAIVLMLSRAIAVTVAVGLLAVFGVFAERALLKAAIVLLALIMGYSVLNLTVDADSSDVKQTFLGKLARSVEEMNMQEYFDFKQINESYRGFESSRALHSYEEGPPWRWVVGQGFGALVDLKVYVPGIGRYIPIFHNGYFYLLFKGGALALLLFLYSLSSMYRLGRRTIHSAETSRVKAGRLMQAVAVGLGVTTWVIAGAFNKQEMFPFLLCAGFLCGYLTDDADATLDQPVAREGR